jgi:hypothetical protein
MLMHEPRKRPADARRTIRPPWPLPCAGRRRWPSKQFLALPDEQGRRPSVPLLRLAPHWQQRRLPESVGKEELLEVGSPHSRRALLAGQRARRLLLASWGPQPRQMPAKLCAVRRWRHALWWTQFAPRRQRDSKRERPRISLGAVLPTRLDASRSNQRLRSKRDGSHSTRASRPGLDASLSTQTLRSGLDSIPLSQTPGSASYATRSSRPPASTPCATR